MKPLEGYQDVKAVDVKVGDMLRAGATNALDVEVIAISIEASSVRVTYRMPGGTVWHGEWELNQRVSIRKGVK